MSDNDDSAYICVECTSTPCDWIKFKEQLTEYMEGKYHINAQGNKADSTGNTISNNILRKDMYQMYTKLRYGYLGRDVKIPVPRCVGF